MLSIPKPKQTCQDPSDERKNSLVKLPVYSHKVPFRFGEVEGEEKSMKKVKALV